MHLSDTEFWRMTPAEFRALVRRWEGAERRADYRAGVIAAILANAHRDPEKHPEGFTPRDFFASLEVNHQSPIVNLQSSQTPEEMRAVLIGVTQTLGGEIEP